jgi:hypothetical protein
MWNYNLPLPRLLEVPKRLQPRLYLARPAALPPAWGRKETSAEDDEGFVDCSGGRLWNRCRTRASEYLLKAARYGQALGRLSTPTDAHNRA